jgi:gas vesicle protein
MDRDDTIEFLTAFAIGTAIGVGLTFLLKPKPTRRERLVRQLRPVGKRMRKGASQLRAGVREGAGATSDFTTEVISAGQELLEEFRGEVSSILKDARGEIKDLVESQVEDLSKAVKRSRRNLGV